MQSLAWVHSEISEGNRQPAPASAAPLEKGGGAAMKSDKPWLFGHVTLQPLASTGWVLPGSQTKRGPSCPLALQVVPCLTCVGRRTKGLDEECTDTEAPAGLNHPVRRKCSSPATLRHSKSSGSSIAPGRRVTGGGLL